jgi:hypothetical protein
MEMVAARAGAFVVEVNADRSAAAALRTGRGLVGERRQVGRVDGGGRDGRAIYHGADRARDRSTRGGTYQLARPDLHAVDRRHGRAVRRHARHCRCGAAPLPSPSSASSPTTSSSFRSTAPPRSWCSSSPCWTTCGGRRPSHLSGRRPAPPEGGSPLLVAREASIVCGTRLGNGRAAAALGAARARRRRPRARCNARRERARSQAFSNGAVVTAPSTGYAGRAQLPCASAVR